MSGLWRDGGTPEAALVGHKVLALHPQALFESAEVVADLPGARKLKVRSGEHLAAILLTAVLGPPTEVDIAGGLDFAFTRDPERDWPLGELFEAAVEVKSLPGQFRETESRMRLGDHFKTVVKSASMVLSEAAGQIQAAIAALDRKASQSQSRNVFLIVHSFDGFAVEAVDDDSVIAIGHRLPKPRLDVHIDFLWVLWHPDLLCYWSRSEDRWVDVVLNAIDPDHPGDGEDAAHPGLERLQVAEKIFLDRVGHRGGSPWLYTLT